MVFIFFSSLEAHEVKYLMSILFRNYGMPWENVESLSLVLFNLHTNRSYSIS